MINNRSISTLTLLLVVALVSAILTLRARSDADWRALVAEVAGQDVVTFRMKQGELFLSSWTPEHLADLRAFEGVREVVWRGGYSYAQGPASAYVLPVTIASPGFLSAQRAAFLAGRDLSEDDAGRPRVILSERHAQTIFPDLTPQETIGHYVQVLDERLEVVGIADEADAAFRAALLPPSSSSERYDVQSVYVRLAEQAMMATVVEQINAYLVGTTELTALEAVPYREFVRPGVVNERLDYVREVTTLFGWLIAFALLLATVNLINQGMFRAAAQRRAWALHRVLGASRANLLTRELTLGLRWEWVAIGVGGVAGALLGIGLGGLATWSVVLLSLLVGAVSLLLGSLPLVWGVLRLYPYQALRRSSGLARHPLLAFTGALGLGVALALVVLTGGFRDLGQAVMSAEIEAIGADLVELGADRASILPEARLTEEDVAALRSTYPHVPMTLLERHQGTVQIGGSAQDATVVAADDSFMLVSGTRLLAGSWQQGGIVLGSKVAETLFPDGDALGQTLTLSGPRLGRVDVPVAAVAEAPSTERLETLQLSSDAVLMPRAALNVFALRAQMYARVGGLTDRDVEELGTFLSQRHPRDAPFAARYVAASYQSFLARLEEQSRQFGLVAVLIFFLAAIGIGMLAVVRAGARVYLRGLERAFGASRAEVFRGELGSITRLTLLVGGLGIGAGLITLWFWTNWLGYVFVVPILWISAALVVTLGIGLVVGIAVARWSASKPPMAVLRGEL